MTVHRLDFGAPRCGSDADAHDFRTEVTLAASDLGGPAWLEVDGIATVYDVLVNGTVVLSGRSMFARHEVEVGDVIRAGANEIAVRCHALPLDDAPRQPRARWRTRLTDDGRLRWFRTTILGRAPGFAPGPPRVGPWREVRLVTGGRSPRVAVRTRLEESAAGASLGVVEVVADGVSDLTGATAVLTAPGGERRSAPVVEGRARLEVPEPQRWWPHSHGSPATYRLVVERDGESLVERVVGFRTLADDDPDGLGVVVNGVPVFVRGVVWTPGDLGALDEAVALGFNLVRVSGIGAYEGEAFVDACAERGLLVWQDLMFATFDYPLADPGFAALVADEVSAEIAALAHSPALAVVCGSAEHEQQAALFGIAPGPEKELAAFVQPLVEAVATDAIWVDSSPTGGAPAVRVDVGIAQYFGVGAYRRDLADARTSGVRFASECLAFSHLPAGAPDSTSEGVPRDAGSAWDFADVRRHYLHHWYAARAGEVAAADPDERARRSTGAVMAAVFGEWRRAASPCRGGIVLWLRDLEPGAGWGLLDHRGRRKPAADELAPVLQPTAVWLVDEGLNGLDVHIAHDPDTALEARLVVELLRADESVAESVERDLGLAPHSTLRLGVEELLGRWVDVTWAYRFGDPAYDAVRATLRAPGLERTALWRRPQS